eukprot:tig00000140_g8485.t1
MPRNLALDSPASADIWSLSSRGLRASRIASVELRFSAGRRQLRGEPLDSKPRTFPARPDVVRANVARAAGGRQASCIQAFEPVWLREKRLAFWQETASCPLTRFIIAHCAVDPTTYVAAPNTEGYMTSVAGIVEYIARTEGPDTSAAVGADIENGRLDETLAGFGSWCRPYSYKLGGVWQTYIRGIVPKAPLSLGESQPALEAIAIPVAQFKDPAPDVGPFLVKPHTKGKGKRTRNSAPAFLPPQPPATAPQQRPGQQRIDEMLPRQGTPTNGGAGPSGYGSSASSASADGPSPLPGPGAVLTAIQGFGAQQEAERRALAARQAREAEERRQALWAQRLQATIAFRAELDSGFRAARSPGRRPRSAGGRSRRSRRGWRRASATATGACPCSRLRVGRGAGGLAGEIDAAEEQAAREEAEDNARFRHLHH